MLHLKITFKPNSRIGNEMVSAHSVMVADISPKLNVWEAYGDEEIAKIWANQILQQRFAEPCTLIQAEVYKP